MTDKLLIFSVSRHASNENLEALDKQEEMTTH